MKRIKQTLVGLVAIAAALGITACAATKEDAYHNQEQVSDSAKGTTAGAVTGAAAAGLAAASTGGVAAVAAGGAAIGGVIGHAWDKDEAAIRTKMQAAGVSVTEVGYSNDIILDMPSDVKFAAGSAKLSPKYKQMLDAVAEVMKQYKYTVANVIGNANGAANTRLSLARAHAVANYLASQGVAANRLIPSAGGKVKGRAKSRGVEIVLHAPPISH